MEKQEVGEFEFNYKKPEEASYSLWVEDCAYILDKNTAQKFVDRMKEHWPGLEYGVTKAEKAEENKKPLASSVERGIEQWRTQTARHSVNYLSYTKYSFEIDDKEFMVKECHKLIDAIIEALGETKDSGPSDLKQSF